MNRSRNRSYPGKENRYPFQSRTNENYHYRDNKDTFIQQQDPERFKEDSIILKSLGENISNGDRYDNGKVKRKRSYGSRTFRRRPLNYQEDDESSFQRSPRGRSRGGIESGFQRVRWEKNEVNERAEQLMGSQPRVRDLYSPKGPNGDCGGLWNRRQQWSCFSYSPAPQIDLDVHRNKVKRLPREERNSESMKPSSFRDNGCRDVDLSESGYISPELSPTGGWHQSPTQNKGTNGSRFQDVFQCSASISSLQKENNPGGLPNCINQISQSFNKLTLDPPTWINYCSPEEGIVPISQFCPSVPPPMPQYNIPPSNADSIPSKGPQNEPGDNKIYAFVETDGYISLHLREQVILDISITNGIRINNRNKQTCVAVSGCGTQLSLMHPKGRVLQYESRIEVQCMDDISIKNAKIYPKGISFTANNCALVYLLDQAGARTTSEQFHDLYESNISDALFAQTCDQTSVTECVTRLNECPYWKSSTNVDCWLINGISVQQTSDGLTIVEKALENGKLTLKVSPTNGKVRMETDKIQVTGSLGEESHMFIRSADRRIHYNGETRVFTVRNAGHAAGFDESGCIKIF